MRNCIKVLFALLLACTPIAYVSANLQKVAMRGHYNDPNEELEHIRRSPIRPIYIDQDDHTITFSSNFVGKTVEVVISNTLIYTTIIGEDGKIVIPDNISGEVELRLYRGDLVYSAIVEL